MSFDKLATQDFEWARVKAFWRQVFTWLRGESNDLLPYDSVRERLTFRGQHDIGLKQVEVDKIVGSTGRYRDFDRAFLPIQTRTRGRWVSIDKAHYQQVILPPVDLYKVGDIYFVQDGNHRVSVARQRGQVYIDAHVIEVVVPFAITQDMDVDAILLEQARSEFLSEVGLTGLRPLARLESGHPDQYVRLREHIDVHRYYLGEQLNMQLSLQQATVSWYDMVFMPIYLIVAALELEQTAANFTATDLYLWVMDYQAFLRAAYRDRPLTEAAEKEKVIRSAAAAQLSEEHRYREVRNIGRMLQKSGWLEGVFLQQERSSFLRRTHIKTLFPDADICPTRPGQYDILLEHIRVHRWYLGEQAGEPVAYEAAAASWYQRVYLPLVAIIRELEIMQYFPDRTETDLYLWIISHQWFLRESLGSDLTLEQAAEEFSRRFKAGEVPGN